MFEFIRRHTKLIMGALFLLILPSFVLWGINGFTSMNDNAAKVATVDGQAITQQEWDSAHQQNIERWRANNPNVDVRLLDTPAMKYRTLESIVHDRVLQAAAADERLMVSHQRVADELGQIPAIASLRRPDGSMDMEKYRGLLSAQGLTPERFEANLRAELAANQTMGGVVNSDVISQAQSGATMDAFGERRQISVQRFAPADYTAKLNPGDADLQAFYQANLARYQVPESARIEYLTLDLDSVKKTVTVPEEALRDYYKQNENTLRAPEERRASHILITAPRDASAADRAKAKAAAEALLAQLRKAPDTFADVARKSSQDSVSAASGGDLGFFQNNKGIDPAIAKAAWALAKAGDISDVVESDFGYHIVRLAAIKPEAVPPFEQVRARLEDQYRAREAQKQFSQMAEEFKVTVFEQADSLKPAAEQFKLAIQTADRVTRSPAPGATGALANARFLSALFSADALQQKRNIAAVEIGANQLASARVLEYTPAHARPFDEVREQVRAAFLGERGAALAREDGQARLQAWSAQPPSAAASLPAAVTVSRQAPENQPPQLIEVALRADPEKLPAFVGVDLGPNGYAVARVEKVLPKADQTADQATQSRQRYEQAWSTAEAQQFYQWLKARHKAAIFAPNPASAPAVMTPAGAASR